MAAPIKQPIMAIFAAQNQMTPTLKKIESDTGRMSKQFTKLSGAIQNAFQFYVRFRIFGLINRAIGSLEHAIPGLIEKGQAWAQTVDEIADSTGLAAEKASLLAGMSLVMAGDTDGLTKALGALSQQVVNHNDVLKRYGIQTKNSNGQLLDSWTILTNVRKAVSEVGASFLSTALARDLFSRGGQVLMDLLLMTPKQFKMMAKEVRESGVIMSAAALAAADQWGRTKRRLDMHITGISNLVTMTVQPALSALVDGFTNYLKANMTQIVSFVSSIVGFVVGMVSGLFDIPIDMKTVAQEMDDLADTTDRRNNKLKNATNRPEKAEDAYTAALNRQIDAIDRQLTALDRVSRSEDRRREHAKLLKDISDAKKELANLRGQSIFAAGMSAAEAELARQAQAGDIVDAQKKVGDAQKKLREDERKNALEDRRFALQEKKASLQEQLAAHTKMLAERITADREANQQLFGEGGAMTKNIKKAMKAGSAALLEGFGPGEGVGDKIQGVLQGISDAITGFFDDPEGGPGKALGRAFDGLAVAATFVTENWKKVAALGVALVASNLLGGLTGMAALLTGPGMLLASIVLVTAAVYLWADALNDWSIKVGIIKSDAAETSKTSGGRSAFVTGQLEAQQHYGETSDIGLGEAIDKILFRGDYETALRDGIVAAMKDPNMSIAEMAAYTKKVNQLVEQMKTSGGLFGFGPGGDVWDDLLVQQALLNTAIGEDGPLEAVKKNTETIGSGVAGAGGRSIAEWERQIATNTHGLNGSLPWGIVNLELNLDNKLALRLLGVPVGGRNSSGNRIR